jgi:hypothetical protein
MPVYTGFTMSNLSSLTSAQLKHAADLKDKISKLEKQLSAILGSANTSAPSSTTKKSKMSAAARAKIAAAQKARWAKVKKSVAKPVAKKKSGISAAGRAKIAAAAKARWAKAKADGKKSL